MAGIRGSVGAGGKNLAPDVTLVQAHLRRHKEWLDTLDVPEVTGKFDRATRDAITSTESRFSSVRAAVTFAILAVRLTGKWRRRWSTRRNRVKRVSRNMSIP